jgi:hypothetical protein
MAESVYESPASGKRDSPFTQNPASGIMLSLYARREIGVSPS